MLSHAAIDGTSSSRCSETLSPHEIPTDTLLPQLPVIMNPEYMKARLQDQLFDFPEEQERFRIRHCEITRARLKPGSSCMVTYRLEIEDRTTRETGEQLLCGRACAEGQSRSQWEKARVRALVPPRFGRALIHIPDLEMVLWSFPNDRRMDTLPALIDPAPFLSVMLLKLLASHMGNEWKVTGATRTLVHYIGEHRCMMRIDATVVHQGDDCRQTVMLFQKTYHDKKGEETSRVMHQLWESEARRSGQLVIAKLVSYDSSLKTLWQLGFKGTSLDSWDIDSPDFLPFLDEAACQLAALHSTSITCARSRTLADLVDNLKPVIPDLIRSRPSCGPVLDPLITRLSAQADRMIEEPRVTLHGDLHLGNVFVNDGHVALIDLDSVRTGSPLVDLGSLIAGLHYLGIQRRRSSEGCHRLVEPFLQTYQANVSWAIHPQMLSWYVAAPLLTRAYRCVRKLKPGRMDLIDDLVTRAQQITCEAERISPASEGQAISQGV
jgi:Phosphotransferase enzyme family